MLAACPARAELWADVLGQAGAGEAHGLSSPRALLGREARLGPRLQLLELEDIQEPWSSSGLSLSTFRMGTMRPELRSREGEK